LALGFYCSFCGEWNDTVIDPTGGRTQSYTEDCQVCCRANVLHISYVPETGDYEINSELE
jgi:hypothetical protein